MCLTTLALLAFAGNSLLCRVTAVRFGADQNDRLASAAILGGIAQVIRKQAQ